MDGLKTSDLVLKLLSKGVSRPLEVSWRAAIKAAVLLGALWLKPDELWVLWAHLDNGSADSLSPVLRLQLKWPDLLSPSCCMQWLIVALVSSTKWSRNGFGHKYNWDFFFLQVKLVLGYYIFYFYLNYKKN